MEYKDIFKASYQRPKEAHITLEGLGYKYDPELSSDKSKVFIDKEGNPHIAFRGTTLDKGLKTAVQDIGTDIMVGLGKTTKREKEAKKLREQVESKYGKPATAYGTSLGGKLAVSSGAKAVTYNRAYGLRDIFEKQKKQDIHYRNPSDIISLPSKIVRGKKSIQVGKKTSDPLFAHSIESL